MESPILQLLYLTCKLFDCHDLHFWPINIFEHTKMSIIGDDIFSTGSNRAVHKFVVIKILFN